LKNSLSASLEKQKKTLWHKETEESLESVNKLILILLIKIFLLFLG
jgi:post-segregation antitoxin (ccd killing protein)